MVKQILVPLIKDYLDVGIKNDDALIKMAGIIQRAMNRSESEGGDFNLSDEEKKQLFGDLFQTALKMAEEGFTSEEIQITCFMAFQCKFSIF